MWPPKWGGTCYVWCANKMEVYELYGVGWCMYFLVTYPQCGTKMFEIDQGG